MPPVGKGWTDRQIAALIAYIESNPSSSGGGDEAWRLAPTTAIPTWKEARGTSAG